MQSAPLLTIAIPTYNRAQFLDLNLRCLSKEILKLPESSRKLINVHVSNNASTDDTASVIERYKDIPANLFIVANHPVNVGANANIEGCYRGAATPYIWILGDDDVVLDGGVERVLQCLVEHNADIIYLNSYGFSRNYLERPKTRAEKRGTRLYDDPATFTKQVHVKFTFISTFVVRTGIQSSINDVLRESSLTQLGWIFPLLRDGRRFSIVREWVVAAKMGNSGGYNLVDVFGLRLQEISRLLLHGKQRLADIVENGAILYAFPALIMRELRSGEGRFSEENLEDKLALCFDGNWRYRLFLVPLVRLPRKMAYVYYFLGSAFLRIFPRLFL